MKKLILTLCLSFLSLSAVGSEVAAVSNDKCTGALLHGLNSRVISISPLNKQSIVVAPNDYYFLQDVETNRYRVLFQPSDNVASVVFSLEDRLLVVKKNGQVGTVEVSSDMTTSDLKLSEDPNHNVVAVSPNKLFGVVKTADNNLLIMNLSEGSYKILVQKSESPKSAVFLSDNRIQITFKNNKKKTIFID